MTSAVQTGGRVAQRRRTRRAIVEAAMQLLAAGAEPSVNDIAAAADVSRRTVYMHFPTLDQLVLDATIGLMNVDVDAALGRAGSDDVRARLKAMIAELYRTVDTSLPLGRKLIKLTVDAPAPTPGQHRRGYRRIQWLEQALHPLRAQLTPRHFEDLVSQLALVIGWEAFIVLADVRGLSPKAARTIMTNAALAIVDAAAGG
jgi:AcrR family transcriptional regulator